MSQRDMYKSHRRKTPSFSSSLLDSIYRSIDGESYGQEEAAFSSTLCREKFTVKEASAFKSGTLDKERKNLRQAIMIEGWMEKRSNINRGSVVYNSTSSSSDSSSGGGVFSSSEAESSYCQRKSRSSSSSTQRKPFENRISGDNKQSTKQKPEGGGFRKTKLRALKIYGELKKVKQPISPGGRIASFLSSIFNSGSGKKVKMCSDEAAMEDVSFNIDDHRKPESTRSSATSFSRSCLSKTPSKLTGNGTKRSVRFYPVSVIVDEDCRPCGHKCIYEDDPSLMPKIVKSSAVKQELMKGRDYLTSSYQKKNVNELDFRRFGHYDDNDADEEDNNHDDDDDAESCSSSDLFELDHLSGIGRYKEELPVYETTNLKTNQAIANGFIL